MANTISVSVLADVRDISRKLGSVDKQLSGFGKTTSRIGGLVKGAFAGLAVGAVFKDVVSGASDAQQSLGATETVFGKFASTVVKDSNKAASQFGLDANTYRENANLIGSLFSNQGVAAKDLAGATKEVIGVSADLAATFGGTTTEAVGALSAAFKGEFDSLEKYGISLKESTISAELAARGQDKLTGSALAAAKQQVTTDLIMQQSSKTRGAFAKESNTLAHQQQVLAARFQNIKDKIGMVLLPVLTRMVAFVSNVVLPALSRWGKAFAEDVWPSIKQVATELASRLSPVVKTLGGFIKSTLVPAVKDMAKWFRDNVDVLVAVGAGLLAAKTALVAYNLYVRISTALTKAWAVAQKILNGTMKANPIGLVVTAIALLVGAMVLAYQRSETFRRIVDKAWSGIKRVAMAVFPVIKTVITTVFRVMWTVVRGIVTTMAQVIKTTWNVIKAYTRTAWNIIKNTVLVPIRVIVAVLRGDTGKAKAIVKDAWDFIKSATQRVWDGIKTAVTSAIGKVVETVKGLKGRVTGAFSGAVGWLKDAGKNIIQGLINGLNEAKQWVIDKIKEIADLLPGWVKKRLGISSPSKVFRDLGRNVGEGLAQGLSDYATNRKVQKAANTMALTVESGFSKPQLAIGASGNSSAPPVTIQFHGPVIGPSKGDMGRWIGEALDEYKRQGGRRLAV